LAFDCNLSSSFFSVTFACQPKTKRHNKVVGSSNCICTYIESYLLTEPFLSTLFSVITRIGMKKGKEIETRVHLVKKLMVYNIFVFEFAASCVTGIYSDDHCT